MKILVCGGRDYTNQARVDEVLTEITNGSRDVTIIEGGARGADQCARLWAIDNGIQVITYPADWDQYGKRAGILRNIEMLEKGDPQLVIAFPGGRGTSHMVNIAFNAGVKVVEYTK